MSKLDQHCHRVSRRKAMPKDDRFVTKVRDISPKNWKESLNWKECGEDLLDYQLGKYYEESEGYIEY